MSVHLSYEPYGQAEIDKPYKQQILRTEERARLGVVDENVRSHAVGDILAHEIHHSWIVAVVKHVSSLPRIILRCGGASHLTLGSRERRDWGGGELRHSCNRSSAPQTVVGRWACA